MQKLMIVPLLFGLAGVALLVGLGVWQLQRLQWKNAVVALIETRLGDAPVTLGAALAGPEKDYQPVRFSGRFTGQELHVLVGLKRVGPAYRIIG
ncbi:MAG: SURF1 family cytochrome oxidase biogenesis protein, partial [Halocynthiibacter sp.]